LNITILQDDKPGHFNQSEGILLALSRLQDVTVERVELHKKHLLPQKSLRFLLKRRLLSFPILWALAYKNKLKDIPNSKLIISAGGDTLLGNVILAKTMNAKNIFAGSVRSISPSLFSAILTPYSANKGKQNHIICLKPAPLILPPMSEKTAKNKKVVVLLGGPSGDYSYDMAEWDTLISFLENYSKHQTYTVDVFTSRRTPDALIAKLDTLTHSIQLHKHTSTKVDIVFKNCIEAHHIFVTEDSTSMITEAIAAQRPVIALKPSNYNKNSNDNRYLQELIGHNWLRTITIATLNKETIDSALKEIQPMKENHLDFLAAALQEKLGL